MRFLTICLLLLFILFLSCCKKSTDPIGKGTRPDTTSHEFIWRIDTLGTYNSYIKDVSIIDKDNIWACGEIMFEDTYTYDSLGNWINPYNVVHWDGIKWNLIRALPSNYDYNYYHKSAVLAFSSKNIWVGDNIASHFNGNEWYAFSLTEGFPKSYSISKILGVYTESLYFIGVNGRITKFSNGNWLSMESGTPLDLYDINGNEEAVFVTGYNFVGDLSGQSVVLQLINNTWQTVFTSLSYSGDISNGDYGRLESVFVFGDTAYFATGGTGMLKYNFKTKETKIVSKNSDLFNDLSLIKIAGTADNDIMLVSAWGNMVHYNGSTWKRIDEVYDMYGPARLFPKNMDYENQTISIVGKIGSRAILIIGEHL